MIETQCRCGQVKLKISGQAVVQLFCHCDDCQAAHSGAFVASAVYLAPNVEVSGDVEPLVIRKTPRMRCVSCAQPIYTEIAVANVRSVNAYLLPRDAFQPQFHVQCQYAVRPVVDDLPHFKGFPPAFGGAQEFVDW